MKRSALRLVKFMQYSCCLTLFSVNINNNSTKTHNSDHCAIDAVLTAQLSRTDTNRHESPVGRLFAVCLAAGGCNMKTAVCVCVRACECLCECVCSTILKTSFSINCVP
jgi:hypothetical protein